MPWNDKYWDTLDQVYWTPEYVGLTTIKPIKDPARPEHLLVARSHVPTGNSLYTRRIRSKDIKDYLLHREETLNHVLDIGLAIAPDELINRLISQPLGIDDAGPYESVGREVDKRFGIDQNAFQQDGFFVSPRSALALEIKLKSPSSPQQVLKYAVMLAMEEQRAGHQLDVGLLYIVPEGAEGGLWRRCGLDGPVARPELVDVVRAQKMPATLKPLVDAHEARVRDVLTRMKLACVSWRWFRDAILNAEKGLDARDPGQQCYARLLLGMRC